MQNTLNNPILSIVDPNVLAIPIRENNEPLVDLKEQSTILVGPSPEIPDNHDYTKMRVSVYNKLVHAQKQLPHPLQFCLYEGYRSLNLQQRLFDDRYQLLQTLHPAWKHEQLFQETVKLISPLINLDGSKNIPPHSTGAAIDVYLVDQHHQSLDMGIHPSKWMQDLDGQLSQTDSLNISKTAKKNRAIMSSALEQAGFVNYRGEYWHWSYGDRYWAYLSNQPFTLYGPV